MNIISRTIKLPTTTLIVYWPLCVTTCAIASNAPEPVALNLPAISIHAEQRSDDNAANAINAARDALSQRAGGTAVVDADSYRNSRASTLTDALAYAPGVLVQSRHGDETRFSIRGSGIQRGFLMRGIQLYQDGTPLNHTDGSGDFQAIDPLAFLYSEVWRGANALEYGANSLGGAVNFVSPTGLTARPMTLRVQEGSFGEHLTHFTAGDANNTLDGFVSAGTNDQEGYRDHSATHANRFFGNLGAQLDDNLSARLYYTNIDTTMEMPGALTHAAMDKDPKQAAPNYARLGATNNYTLRRTALELTWQPGLQTKIISTAFVADRDRYHAMTYGILDQEIRDVGVNTRVVSELGSESLPRRVTFGVMMSRLSGTEDRFANVSGHPGRSTGENKLKASQQTVFTEYTHGIVDHWAVQGGLQAVHATREMDNLTQPSRGYKTDYNNTSPKVGLIYSPDVETQVYANISRSFEAPPFGELVVSPNFPMADVQRATTYEVGFRKHTKQMEWDVSIYQANIRGELLSLTNAQGVDLGTVNADRTIHRGVELGATLPITNSIRWRTNYLYNDFRFDDDARYGNNQLAGIPPQLLRSELKFAFSPHLFVAPAVEISKGKTWIDHANTKSTDGYLLWNLTVGGELTKGLNWFVDGRNLANRTYVSTTNVVADARGIDGAYYFPGDERSMYVGLEWRME